MRPGIVAEQRPASGNLGIRKVANERGRCGVALVRACGGATRSPTQARCCSFPRRSSFQFRGGGSPASFWPGRRLPAHGVGLAEATRLWLRVALLSFGGAGEELSCCHASRIVVQEPHWIFRGALLSRCHRHGAPLTAHRHGARSRRIGMRLVPTASSSASNPNSTASGPASATPVTSPVDVMCRPPSARQTERPIPIFDLDNIELARPAWPGLVLVWTGRVTTCGELAARTALVVWHAQPFPWPSSSALCLVRRLSDLSMAARRSM